MLPLSCIKCPHCYDDDEALYCAAALPEVCFLPSGAAGCDVARPLLDADGSLSQLPSENF